MEVAWDGAGNGVGGTSARTVAEVERGSTLNMARVEISELRLLKICWYNSLCVLSKALLGFPWYTLVCN